MVNIPKRLPQGILKQLADHLKWVEDPFMKVDRRQALKPNVVFEAGKPASKIKYVYTTDASGRLKTAHAWPLKLSKGRLPHSKSTPGKIPGDHAGHLIADVFGGSPKINNLVSQSSDVNLSKMATLERKWKSLLEANPNTQINLDIEVLYSGAGTRPTGFKITEFLDGREVVHKFANS